MQHVIAERIQKDVQELAQAMPTTLGLHRPSLLAEHPVWHP